MGQHAKKALQCVLPILAALCCSSVKLHTQLHGTQCAVSQPWIGWWLCVLTHTRASCCPWMVWVHEACSLLGTKSQTHCWIQGQGRSLKIDVSIYQTKATSSKTVPVANTLISKAAIPHEAQGAPLIYGPGRISLQWAGSKSEGTVTNSELIVKIWNPPLGLHNLVCVPQVQVPVLSVYDMGSSQGLTCVAWIPTPEINVGSMGSR